MQQVQGKGSGPKASLSFDDAITEHMKIMTAWADQDDNEDCDDDEGGITDLSDCGSAWAPGAEGKAAEQQCAEEES